MKFKKTLTSAMALLLISSVVAGCSTGDKPKESSNSSAPTQSTSTGPVKLRILWWGSQARHDATQKALELYTKKNSNVTFEKEYSTWDGYWDKLAVQYTANNAPDIIQMDATYLNDYSTRNLLADLSSVSTEDIDKGLIDTGKVNGKLYGFPISTTSFGMVYDKVALEKFGIQAPKDGWTWDDFFKFAKEAKAKIGNDKYVFVDENIQAFYQYAAYQYGQGKGFPITEAGKFNYDKASFLDWGNKLAELRKIGALPPAEKVASDVGLDPNQDMIIKGTALMGTLNSGQFSSLDSLKPNTFAMVTMPKGTAPSGWLKASMYWSVNAQSKNVEEAKKFVDWFMHDSEAAIILGKTRGLPASKKLVDQLKPNFSAADKAIQDAIDKTAQYAQVYKPDPKGWSNFGQKEYKSIYEKLMYGQITPEQAFDELTKKGKEYENK
ncbi:ABC transporter substrate-binding protein [Paenibacillus ferrarius]|uniref:ABC transporter substrate-binding protein n=1 Tax=Paenibacillus ferrarius TaxID=1469647 RepID=UPI003D2AC7A2